MKWLFPSSHFSNLSSVTISHEYTIILMIFHSTTRVYVRKSLFFDYFVMQIDVRAGTAQFLLDVTTWTNTFFVCFKQNTDLFNDGLIYFDEPNCWYNCCKMAMKNNL